MSKHTQTHQHIGNNATTTNPAKWKRRKIVFRTNKNNIKMARFIEVLKTFKYHMIIEIGRIKKVYHQHHTKNHSSHIQTNAMYKNRWNLYILIWIQIWRNDFIYWLGLSDHQKKNDFYGTWPISVFKIGKWWTSTLCMKRL